MIFYYSIYVIFSNVCSIKYLQHETEKRQNLFPSFTVEMILDGEDILFHPALDEDDPDGLHALLDRMCSDIVKMAELVPRVDTTYGEQNYKSTCIIVL